MIARGMVVAAGSSNAQLAEEIAGRLRIKLADVDLRRFSNGEIYARFCESVRGTHTFVIQSLSEPVNENFMELLVMLDALKRASPAVVSAVVPHYGYARQDKKGAPREPISAKLVADLVTVAGANRVITMDLHHGQIQGYFNFPVDHLTSLPTLAAYFREKRIPDLVVVSPDVGRVKVAKKFADKLGAELAILHKERPAPNVAKISELPGKEVIGEIAGKNTILIDDMIDTGGTIVAGAQALVRGGAARVYAAAAHAVFSGPASERLAEAPLEEIVVTNTIAVPPERFIEKVTVLSVAPLFAQAIKNVFEDSSVSDIFEGENQL